MDAARGSGETGGCRHPDFSSVSSYNLGCRCKRCKRGFSSRKSELRYGQVNRGILKDRKQACADCGWNKIPSVLEFHHTVVDPSNIPMNDAVNKTSTPRFLRELDKGLFLCPNCHRCRHYDPVKDRVDLTNPGLR